MTYDIHGLWDQKNLWTGPYVKGHTNLTEIEEGFDLLWRNSVSPNKVVMGVGFYGRSFTMSDVSCSTPPSCRFDSAGFSGECTGEPGVLSYSEVMSRQSQLGSRTSYDKKSSVKWMVYGSNQWISFDDSESFEAKKYLFSRCLKGLMIWSMDLDTQDHQAMTGLFGEEAMEGALRHTGLDAQEAERLAFDLYARAATRQSKLHTRPSKRIVISPWRENVKTAHGDPSAARLRLFRATASGSELLSARSLAVRVAVLCYDSTEILQKCHWSNCCWVSTEMVPDKDLCGDNEVATTRRYNNGQGSPCGLEQGPNSYRQPSQAFCCPKNDKFEKCVWRRDELGCKPAQCAKDKLQITSALLPSWKKEDYKVISRECIGTPGYPIPPMRMPQYPLCCEPPSRYGKKGPVEPSYLWSHCYDSKDDDVTWEFSDNFGNNNKDTMPGVMEDDPGTDP
ncbi:hypothetical protein NUU61_003824 [Penicillium alfredii]|uniref:chitinase n=1 Tax=Penicillium alfredii TaxID=1506179 RepID=A0A9W9FKH6_9EURO|nr:uncharacterized protein NUU61_003824 [Penicillium alfredii]KAJ5101602.1 hypothetical protein NUU61_003824 [Penicillium alfredii]